ncbi:MAG: glycosyl hydrolase family 8 [Polyangiaceae bacterium]
MRKYLLLLSVSVSALASWSCDSGDSSEGGAGAAGASTSSAGAPHAGAAQAGATATAGAHTGGASAGGSSAAGASNAGASNAGAPTVILGSGGPFPFPQNKKPGACTLTTAANASASVQSAYNSWKSAMVTANGAGTGGLRVQRNQDGNDTVSEGIGYGMIAAAYLADRTTFDGLWTFAKAHFDSNGLMNWHLNADGSVASNGMGSASDADEDMAWALIMASNQWSSATYLNDAKAVINAMYTTSLAPDGTLKPGDNWGGTTKFYPDYFSPAYYRVFAQVTGNKTWSTVVIDRNYVILDKVAGSHGLVPDFTTTDDYSTAEKYGYDACRTPWRIGLDYCFNGEPRAKAYLDKIGPFFSGIGAANINDGYANSGSSTGSNKNMAFIGPAGVSGMAGYQTLLDGAFSFGVTNADTEYYKKSVGVLSMLMMSGNFVDFTKP